VVKLIKTVILIPILVVLLTGCISGQESGGTKEGESAPDFRLQSLDGETVSLSDYHGQAVLLNFWATWCGPCVGEMPYLQEIHEEWTTRGLALVAVNVGETSSQVNGFMNYYNLSLPVLLDTQRSVSERYNIIGIPTTFFIDKDGIIQGKVVGAFPSKESIERYLEDIIP